MIALSEQPRPARRASSPDAEAQVVGACLLHPDAVTSCREALLTPSDFATRNYAAIYAGVLAVEESGQVPEPLTVAQYMASHSEQGADDWYTLTSELQDACMTAAHVSQHVVIVKEYAQRRSLQQAATVLVDAALDQRIGVNDALDAAEQTIFAARPSRTNGARGLESLIPEALERFGAKQRSPEQVLGVPTAWAELNRLTFGWHPGQMIVIAARPSVGKSSFALQCAAAAAMNGDAVFFATLEMSAAELTERMVAIQCRIPLMGFRGGSLSDPQMVRLARGSQAMKSWDIHIEDMAGSSIGELRSRARRHKPKNGKPIKLAVVDYLQLVSSAAESRQNEVAAVSRGLKAMAKELGCPVIALSQLNRGLEQRGKDAEPQLSDLRESGSIEQDADAVVALHRPDKENPEALALLLKNRQGPLGRIPLQFRKSCAAFDSQPSYEP